MNDLALWLLAGDAGLRTRWNRRLAAEGWAVVELGSSECLAELPGGRAGAALLDAALLREGDILFLRGLGGAKVPVVLFGDGPDASNERVVQWLKGGADDFVPASIHERLLTAKLEAHARRIVPAMDQIILASPGRRIKADTRRGLAWTKDRTGRWELTPALTKTEHGVLCLFLSHPETPLEKDAILERLWGEKADDVFSATLTQHVMSLRKKLGPAGRGIRTVYGRGYMLLEEKNE